MAPDTFNKRARERALQDRAKEKQRRREERRNNKGERSASSDGIDPDIAGIVPGPQPLPPDDDPPVRPAGPSGTPGPTKPR